MPTDIQYKDELRKERIMYQEYLELLENGKYNRLTRV